VTVAEDSYPVKWSWHRQLRACLGLAKWCISARLGSLATAGDGTQKLLRACLP
jgi:hypothetical protein